MEVGDRELFDSIAEGYGVKDLAPSSRPARRWRLDQTVSTVRACVIITARDQVQPGEYAPSREQTAGPHWRVSLVG